MSDSIKLFQVVATSKASYSTEVMAENLAEARKKAREQWLDCDISEIEFYNTEFDVWEDE